jgi:hypothetical protein
MKNQNPLSVKVALVLLKPGYLGTYKVGNEALLRVPHVNGVRREDATQKAKRPGRLNRLHFGWRVPLLDHSADCHWPKTESSHQGPPHTH